MFLNLQLFEALVTSNNLIDHEFPSTFEEIAYEDINEEFPEFN